MNFDLDLDLPGRLDPEALTRSIQGVAAATVKARHPGPRMDLEEPLLRMMPKPPRQVSPIRSPQKSTGPLVLSTSHSPDLRTSDIPKYDPYNPYYKGATEDVRRVNYLQRTAKLGQPSTRLKPPAPAASSATSEGEFQVFCDKFTGRLRLPMMD